MGHDAFSDRSSSGGGRSSASVQVDLAGLVEFAAVVRRENEVTLWPQAVRVNDDLADGVCFGRSSASGAVYAAKERYQQSLIRANEQMSAYLLAADVLAGAAERIAANYSATDAMSIAKIRDVDEALATAVGQARRTHPMPVQEEPS